jgi:pSer/pThr/pTyr-binding forkhead associated (FHA) protein
MFKLVIQDDEGKTTVVPLIRDEITIGRKEGNTIRLTERNVSRRHARILRNNGEVQIEDLGSYNGIRVNNARIAERVSLRVSDQVQIGDYKLYLKAEGVEQVDDAQTRPIERQQVDTAPTDVMSVVSPAPTQTMPVTPTPAPGQLVTPRTLVQIADTDSQGRPVKSAADVAKLTAPTGYGKLVVLSSNFAGKEFELSRPQMIIGRTDENDIVVNHRSISRNHAKLVREPESGRYTISDLQSSNGVRVNGQDYGKVELRRGDVVDLGHVRLRFVEPGEDFVFARDAVITDVPDAGNRRGLLVAVVLSVIVLAVIIAVVVMRGGGDGKKPELGGSGGSASGVSGSGTEPPPDAELVANTPIDAPGVVPQPTLVDAPQQNLTGTQSEVEVECLRYQTNEKWGDLDGCADRLKPFNPGLSKELKNKAVQEGRSAPRIAGADAALRDKNLKRAKTELEGVWTGSTSYQRLKARYDAAENQAIVELVAKLDRVNSGDCKEYNVILGQERGSKPPRVAAEAARQVKCNVIVTPPPAACDADQSAEKGKELFAAGSFGPALIAYDAAILCRPDPGLIQKAFVVACNMRNVAKAKSYWKRMSQAMRTQANNVCVRNGITEDDLNAL